jgi:hypothetical protein
MEERNDYNSIAESGLQDKLVITGRQTTNSIRLHVNTEEVIRLSEGKFYFKGEEVEDRYQVYERFNEWLTMAEEERNKPTLRWSSKWDQMR